MDWTLESKFIFLDSVFGVFYKTARQQVHSLNMKIFEPEFSWKRKYVKYTHNLGSQYGIIEIDLSPNSSSQKLDRQIEYKPTLAIQLYCNPEFIKIKPEILEKITACKREHWTEIQPIPFLLIPEISSFYRERNIINNPLVVYRPDNSIEISGYNNEANYVLIFVPNSIRDNDIDYF